MHPYHPQSRISLFACLLLALPAIMPLRAQQDEALTAAEQPAIAIVPQDGGFNMKIVEQLNPYYVITTLDPPVFNWFAGTYTNLPIDIEVTIGLDMNGMDKDGGKADVSKWVGLQPVMTYADPLEYETYEWFEKDDSGSWVSGDPLKIGEEKYAGKGNVPIQSVISTELAHEFLSEDGRYWQAWKEIDSNEVLTSVNIYRMKLKFKRHTATIAMRIPYTYTFQQKFIRKLKEKKFPGISIDKILTTDLGLDVNIIRVEDPDNISTISVEGERVTYDFYPIPKVTMLTNKTEMITHVITGREHGTEPTSSWVVFYIIAKLLAEDIKSEFNFRRYKTWILIPIFDIDGSYQSKYSNIIDSFAYRSIDSTIGMTYSHVLMPTPGKRQNEPTPSIIAAYATYLRTLENNRRPIYWTTSFHNPECNEYPVALQPYIIKGQEIVSEEFTDIFFSSIKKDGYTEINSKKTALGVVQASHRLAGWCNLKYGSFGLTYEINDRYPDNNINLKGIRNISIQFMNAYNDFIFTNHWNNYIDIIKQTKLNRINSMNDYYKHYNDFINEPSLEMILKGY